MPLSNISIVIPSFNRPELALRAIKSAQKNMVKGDELWLVDDGSSKSYQLVKDYCNQHEPLNYLYAKNGGVSSARNIGLSKSKHSLVAFLDDDDEWLEGHLQAHRAAFAYEPKLVAAFSNFYDGSDDNNLQPNGVSRWSAHKRDLRLSLEKIEFEDGLPNIYIGNLFYDQLLADHMSLSSLSVNKHLIQENRFEVGLKRNQSWLFSSRCCQKGSVAFIDASLVLQHSPGVVRATNISAEETMLSRLYVMEKVWGRDDAFLEHYNNEFIQWYFNDFYGVFRSALSLLKPNLLWRAYKIVGWRRFILFCAKAFVAIAKQQKPIYRNA
ncbi:glycosyltransferase [Reinekea forsetii]|nr:glycosyltransferase [Reinekea forsetii]